MAMPKTLLLTDADVFAGTERHMLDLAEALHSADVPVHIACPTPSPLAQRSELQGIPVVSVPKRGFIDFAAAKQMASLLRAGEIDIIHAHNGRTHLAAAMAIAKAGRGTCVATQHFLSPSRVGRKGPKAWLSAAAHRWVTRRTARFIAISQAVKNEAVSREPATDPRIHVVLNGIRPPDAATLRPPGEIRAALKVAADAPMIFCAARLQKEKDILTLIAAMAIVAAAEPAARCFIAGEGDQKAALEQAIRDGNLAPHVQLLGFRADVLDLMQAADLFVLPSAAEPFGLVILEAMSLGRPVIATRAGGPCEIVDHDRTGLLVTPRDAADLAAGIQRLIGDAALRERFGAAGRARFLQHFTAKRMAAETLAVYHAAMERANV
jgi:glycosyltransferase involved in cell wall biosynthesis